MEIIHGLKDHEIRELINQIVSQLSISLDETRLKVIKGSYIDEGENIPQYIESTAVIKLPKCVREMVAREIISFLKKNQLRLDWKDDDKI